MKSRLNTSESLTRTDIRTLLQGKRLRCTAARVAILECLDKENRPQRVGEVAKQLATYGFDTSTIYRALKDLSTAGLVNRLEVAGAGRHFELSPAAGIEHDAHPHFVCTECDRIYCLAPSQIALKSDPHGTAFPGKATEVLVKGRCTDCQ